METRSSSCGDEAPRCLLRSSLGVRQDLRAADSELRRGEERRARCRVEGTVDEARGRVCSIDQGPRQMAEGVRQEIRMTTPLPSCRPPKRIQIRASHYRGKDNFTVTASAEKGWPPSHIVTKTREGAEEVRAALRRCDQEAVSRILLEGR